MDKIIGACAKKEVTAIIEKDGQFYVGKNLCDNPQKQCPREKNDGYEKCKTICEQGGHAEVNAISVARENAKGGNLYLIGHDHCCEGCLDEMRKAGIEKVIFNEYPNGFKK